MLDTPIKKAVVYLDPRVSLDLAGQQSVYRTRMALADNAELVILAGREEFGEDKTIDSLIRKYGYNGSRQRSRRLKPTPIWPRPECSCALDPWLVGRTLKIPGAQPS